MSPYERLAAHKLLNALGEQSVKLAHNGYLGDVVSVLKRDRSDFPTTTAADPSGGAQQLLGILHAKVDMLNTIEHRRATRIRHAQGYFTT